MATPLKDKTLSKSFKFFSMKTLKLNLTFHKRQQSPKSTSSSPKINNTTNHNHEELRRVFNRFDGDGDGKISAFELRDYFSSIGEYISEETAQETINLVDIDADGSLGFEDFVGLMSRQDLNGDGDGDGGDLKTAFEMFEVEKGSGFITAKGLQKMLKKLGESKSYKECENMIKFYDIDGNGVVDFREFCLMMTN